MLSYICSPFLLPFLSSIFSFLPKSFHSALLPLFHLSFYPLILFFPFIFPSFPPSFFPSSFPPSILCIIVWTQLCALHTFCFMWLQPHVLLLFGQCRDNQICVKCSFTLIGVSTQIGFQLPAQMWLCLLRRAFKSKWDLMNRWEWARQIWAGSVNPARVDWHTNQQRTEWECVFFTDKLSVPVNMSLFCSSVLNDL